jgi:hypothetical protein
MLFGGGSMALGCVAPAAQQLTLQRAVATPQLHHRHEPTWNRPTTPPPPQRFIYLFCSLGYFSTYNPATLLPIVAIVCLVCTLIESLPLNKYVDDNFRWGGGVVIT